MFWDYGRVGYILRTAAEGFLGEESAFSKLLGLPLYLGLRRITAEENNSWGTHLGE